MTDQTPLKQKLTNAGIWAIALVYSASGIYIAWMPPFAADDPDSLLAVLDSSAARIGLAGLQGALAIGLLLNSRIARWLVLLTLYLAVGEAVVRVIAFFVLEVLTATTLSLDVVAYLVFSADAALSVLCIFILSNETSLARFRLTSSARRTEIIVLALITTVSLVAPYLYGLTLVYQLDRDVHEMAESVEKSMTELDSHMKAIAQEIDKSYGATKSLSPLEQSGRDVFSAEGCYNCHRTTPPRDDDEDRWGSPIERGSKKTAPNLAGVGQRLSRDELVTALVDPRSAAEGRQHAEHYDRLLTEQIPLQPAALEHRSSAQHGATVDPEDSVNEEPSAAAAQTEADGEEPSAQARKIDALIAYLKTL